ncbi:MAG TPA: transglycosylase SLT domain-containing protein [Rhodocyclaceae bacterium]|nr:transglycosylase SLT domain-containing protein [Rhodocyclaceae bacterium]
MPLLRSLPALLACALALPSGAHAEAAEPTQQITPDVAEPLPATVSPTVPPTVPPAVTDFVLTQPAAQDIQDDLPPLPTIDLITPPDNLWQRIRNGFGMPDLHSPLVADRQAWYLNRPDQFRRIIERSGRYLYHIVDELERRGMPTELALLPMVESAFNPLAASPARALGMWQFIPSTGKNYKLDQNWWRDERRDIIASTSAALDYLQKIYEMHGDWHLALASYNWGEGAVARAVAKNRAKGLPTDYVSLTMPGETRYYVPKLQALKNIIAQPELYGFQLDAVPNRPYFGTVGLPGDMDITVAAKLAEVPLAEFIALNPAYHRPLMRGAPASQLVLPTEKIQVFQTNLERYEAQDKPLTHWRTYRLKPGEKLETVAGRFGLSAAHLKQLNGITRRVKVGPGLNLLVPGPGAQLSDQLAAQLPKVPAESRKVGKKKRSIKGSPKHKASGASRKPATGKKRR